MSSALLYTAIGVYWSTRSQTAITATGYALATILSVLLVLPVLVVVLPTLLPTWFSENTNTWMHVMLAVHPYASILFTQESLRTTAIWSEAYTINGSTVVGPAMWILTVAVSWFWSCIAVILSIRRLTPHTTKGAS
jgi:hypothetical protein